MVVKIHRAEPYVTVQGKRIRLTRAEHALITALGMSDNRVVPADLLMDVVFHHPVRIPADRDLLWTRIGKLRKKIGHDLIRSKRQRGYCLRGAVEFR